KIEVQTALDFLRGILVLFGPSPLATPIRKSIAPTTLLSFLFGVSTMPKREHFEQCLSAFLAIGLAFLSTATALAENTAQVATYQQANGPHYFAMSVSLPEPVEAGTPEVVMLVDTSASQAGLYREDAIAAAKSALAALPTDARVQFL